VLDGAEVGAALKAYPDDFEPAHGDDVPWHEKARVERTSEIPTGLHARKGMPE